MSPRNLGSQIIISSCYKRIDETNIPSPRRVYKYKNGGPWSISLDLPKNIMDNIVQTLFPEHEMWDDTATVSVGNVPLFTEDQLQVSVQSIKNN